MGHNDFQMLLLHQLASPQNDENSLPLFGCITGQGSLRVHILDLYVNVFGHCFDALGICRSSLAIWQVSNHIYIVSLLLHEMGKFGVSK
jgi:hypothetical protein